MQNGRIVMPPSEYTAATQSSAQSGLATLTTKIPGGNALDLLGKVRAVVSAVLCATCSFIFVLMIHPDSSTDWDAPTIIVWTVALFCAVGIGDLVPHRVAILAQPGTLVDTASRRVPPGLGCHHTAPGPVVGLCLRAAPSARSRRAWQARLEVAEATISCSMWQTALIRNIPRTAKTI